MYVFIFIFLSRRHAKISAFSDSVYERGMKGVGYTGEHTGGFVLYTTS